MISTGNFANFLWNPTLKSNSGRLLLYFTPNSYVFKRNLGHFWIKKFPINLGPLRKFQNIFHILGHFRTFKVSGNFVNIYCDKIILVYFRTIFPNLRISVKSHFIAITLIVQHQTSFKVSFWIRKSNP